ncbi:anaphase-promoting complex APC subunit 1 (macronuclear) [Tetrahymena thermophila SB210]|uniref:Anaphase-promoting complex APC subunit 1 n=1 Tax=Tetrahymena thermophila (strain SB210) TaxID=312017 RepID=Q22DQ5_TETTS|nr:anaphase-promoting complex APC subunit 1 [Tetrahymena thermophila SB210]EAR83399.1 anaphase-promoting complex APC subunit 1 [Tetrahymena thermophila SB210]|eukprot:XP_001031062.1 anaphase-promoting complex APC subunit 1 [Tetrahymena thermophila SB210]
MIIRKPTKIELKPEDDFEEYEMYKQEQHEQLSKYNKNQDNCIGQFGSDFGIGIHTSNRYNQQLSLGGTNDRSFIGGSYQSTFQGGFNHNSSISESSINNFSSNNQASFDRSQTGSNSTEGGQYNQLFSALIGGQSLIRPTHTVGNSQQNPNPQTSLNNSN